MATEDAGCQLRWRCLMSAILILVATTLGSSQGQVSCPARCRSCVGEIVDCSNSRLAAPPLAYPDAIKTINIEGNHIRALGSRSFRINPNIEVLRAAGNRIRRLSNDAFWRRLPGLVTLDLSRNRIRRITSNALRNMTTLTTLDLSRNEISSLRRIFHGTPNLYQLKLARNQIPSLDENDLAQLTELHNIDLRANRISSVHPRAFKMLTKLRYLYLNQNPIGRMTNLDIGSEVLQMVDVSHAELTAVPKPFPASVREMRLDHNLIEQVNHTDFLGMENLQMLTMNDNRLNFFADGALAHLTNLRELWLRNNHLVYVPRNLPDTVGQLIMDSNRISEIETNLFRPNSQLVFVDFHHNQVVTIQPNTFSGLQFLQTIRLSNNQLGALMADSFVGLGSLATLTLASNPLTFIEQGAFRNLANLTTLDLSYVEGGPVELQYDFLQEMLRLETLNLFGSTHLAQRVLDKVRDAGHVTPLSELQTMDVRYANLQTVPSRVRQLFPNIRSFLLDGNPLRCTESLRWLRHWMDEAGSTVQFHEHAEPTCNSPLRLRGRALASLAHAEWGADDEVDALPSAAGGDGSYGYNGGMVNDQPQEHQQGMPVDGQYFMRPMPVEEAKAPKLGPQIQNEAETQELGSKMAASQDGKMAASKEGKMGASKEGKMAASQEGKMAASQEGKMAAKQDGKMGARQEGKMAASKEGKMAADQEGKMADKMADKSKSMPRPMNMVLAPAGGLENTKRRDGNDMEVTPAGKLKKYRLDRKNGKKVGRKGRKINRRQGRRGKKGRKLGRGKTRNRKDRQSMKSRKNRERKRRRRVTIHTGKQA